MRIGFYAPLKRPDHPVPSGDRQMARLLIAALKAAGHAVHPYSSLRSFAPTPDAAGLDPLLETARHEVDRLCGAWASSSAERPDLLFTYHLYYKAPDLLGPRLAAAFDRPYVTAEASLSPRRAKGPWAERQSLVADAVSRASLNFHFTDRDRDGLAETARPGSLVSLPPFIDAAPFGPAGRGAATAPVRLVTLAMMRPGDKADSYRVLADALASLGHLAWHLTIIGDGPARRAVMDAFAAVPADCLTWAGVLDDQGVADRLRAADMLVWPGFNEAFGLCYLEAQASGLPVVAVRNAGTPSVIRHGETGLLTEPDPTAFAAAIALLIADAAIRRRMGAAAARFVHTERSLPAATAILQGALRRFERIGA